MDLRVTFWVVANATRELRRTALTIVTLSKSQHANTGEARGRDDLQETDSKHHDDLQLLP
jgi:hypothetical protein